MSVTTTRPDLRKHVHPGVRVFHVTRHRVYRLVRHRVYRLVDLHDEDRTAQMRGPDGTRFSITYGELMRNYRLVQPF